MQKLEHNQKNLNLCIRQLNALKDAGSRIISDTHNADYADFLLVKEATTNHLLSYFINGNEIRERVKEMEETKLEIENETGWFKMLGVITLYYIFPPTALYYAIMGHKDKEEDVQQVYTILGQADSLIFVIKDKMASYNS